MKQTFEHKLTSLAREEDGATLTELAIVVSSLLLMVMGAVEFGRFGYNEVLAQKATDLAARTAAVRPAVCAGVPDTFTPGFGAAPRFGTLCRVGSAGETCAAIPQTDMPTCTLASPAAGDAAASAAADEIWETISPLLPRLAQRSNVEITYTHDPNIGFLGGPYTPIVTVELTDIPYVTITPLGELARIATANSTGGEAPDTFTFPNMSASIPGEDLGQGIGS